MESGKGKGTPLQLETAKRGVGESEKRQKLIYRSTQRGWLKTASQDKTRFRGETFLDLGSWIRSLSTGLAIYTACTLDFALCTPNGNFTKFYIP